MASDRDKRARVEELQAEVAALERAHHEVNVALAGARMSADEAEAREAELRSRVEPKRHGRAVLRWGITSLVVFAVFAAVIGSVTMAVHAYTVAIKKRSAPE